MDGGIRGLSDRVSAKKLRGGQAGRPVLLQYQDAPGLFAYFYFFENGAGGHVDDGDVVRRAVGGEEELLVGRESDAPGAVAYFEGAGDVAGGGFQHYDLFAAASGHVELSTVVCHRHAHRLESGADVDGLGDFELHGIDHAERGV